MRKQWMGVLLLGPCLLLGSLGSALCGEDKILTALEILRHSPTARGLLKKMETQFHLHQSSDWMAVLQWSTVSRTNAVLTRYFNPNNGKEQRERHVTIFLRQEQSLADLVLDIAHEMTHAVARPAWDPYDPELTPASYLDATLEGEGGEVDALVIECQVGLELSEKYGFQNSRCHRYKVKKTSRIDRDLVRRDFYKVGSWHGELMTKLGIEAKRFPLLSSEKPKLFSSTGKAPYPAALLKEYEEMTQVACENTRRRLRSVRSVARSENSSGARFLARRCHGTSVALIQQ